MLETDQSSKEYRKNWARLIQKIYEVDPLTCPKCQGTMRIISFIEDWEVIKANLTHLGLWLAKSNLPQGACPTCPNQDGSGKPDTSWIISRSSHERRSPSSGP
jgi:hypothetical protein